MSDETCQCPLCGRLHNSLGFGAPPESISRSQLPTLIKFYAASNVADLVANMAEHITRLQSKIPPIDPRIIGRVREG